MKKVLAAVISALAICALCAFAAGCSSKDVSGNSYTFEHIEFDDSGFTTEDRTLYDNATDALMERRYRGTFVFGTDGTVTHEKFTGTYTQDGGNLTIVSENFNLKGTTNGKSVKFEETITGFSFGSRVIYFEFCKV